jgi:hypothetical protein
VTAQQPLTYDAFVELAATDSAVVGLVLKGSQAHEGMTTQHSDYDLYVVLANGATTALTQFTGHRTPELDLVILSLEDFRAAGMPGFERYALARARIVLDRLDGGIAQILDAKARGSMPTPTPSTARSRTTATDMRSRPDSTPPTASGFCWSCSSLSTIAPAPTTSTWNGSLPDSRCPAGTPTCCSTPRAASQQRAKCPHSVVSSPKSRKWPARPGTARCWTHGVRTWT